MQLLTDGTIITFYTSIGMAFLGVLLIVTHVMEGVFLDD